MIWVVLSIISASFLFVVFKLFDRFQVHRFTAVVLNYLFAGLTGLLVYRVDFYSSIQCTNCMWFVLVLGIVFLSLFNLIGYVTVKNGASIAVLANKMAFVIPVLLSIIFFSERLEVLSALALIVGLVGLYLAVKSNSEKRTNNQLLWPIILFAGSGILDFLLKVGERWFLSIWDSSTLTIGIFISAFSWGVFFGVSKNMFKITKKNVLWAAILGIPNFFSIFFLFEAIKSFSDQSAVVFPVNNVGIILCTALLAFVVFKERLSRINLLGLVLCIISIAMLTYNV